MPDATDKECHEKIEIDSLFALTISPKRYVNIVAQKFTQGDMPSSPKLLNVDWFVGRVEVFRELYVK